MKLKNVCYHKINLKKKTKNVLIKNSETRFLLLTII